MWLNLINVSLSLVMAQTIPTGPDNKPSRPGVDPGCYLEQVPETPFANVPTFEDADLTYTPCDDSNLPYLLRKTMWFVRGLPTAFNGSSKFGQSVIGNQPWDYFTDRIRHVRIARANDYDCESLIGGYYSPADADQVSVCQSFAGASIIQLAGLLLHESRHRDGPGHIRCTHAPLNAVDGGCDLKMSDNGSYSIQQYLMVGLVKAKTLSESVHMEARASWIVTNINNFTEPAIPYTAGVALQRLSGEVDFYEGTKLIPLIENLSPDWKMQKSFPNLSFANKELGRFGAYHYEHKIVESASLDFSDEASKKVWIENVGSDELTCELFSTRVFCRDRQDGFRLDSLPPPNFSFRSMMVLNQQWFNPSLPDKRVLLVSAVDKQGNVGALSVTAPLPKKGGMFGRPIANSGLVLDLFSNIQEPPPGMNLGGSLLALFTNVTQQHLEIVSRDLRDIGKVGKKIKVAPGTEDVEFTQMTGPFFWSQALEDL